MKKNRVILLVAILLAVIAGMVLLSYSKGTYKEKIRNFAVADTSLVTKIFMADKSNNTILLERERVGEWLLNGKLEASSPVMEMFLETLHRLKVKAPVPKKSTDFIFKQLSFKAVKVEVYEQRYRINLFGLKYLSYEKMTKCYYVGDPTQDNMGTFMLMDGADIPFVVYLPGFRGFVASRYSLREDDWRSHRLFSYAAPEIKSVSLHYNDSPENSFDIDVDESGRVHFQSNNTVPTSIDTLKIVNYLNSLKNINIESFLNHQMDPKRLDSIIHTEPMQVLSIIPKKGESKEYKLFPVISTWDVEPGPSRDHFYILDEDGMLMMGQYFIFDKILRKSSYFY